MRVKPVIILDKALPLCLKANFAAVLGMSLGRLRPDLVGADLPTQDGVALAGITTLALPILGAPAADLPDISPPAPDCRYGWPLSLRAAFEARDHADHAARVAAAPLSGHIPQAIL